MTIYVLRSDNLVKIGFSEDVSTRVRAIIASIPVPVEFVGHMPGGADVEKHLHDRFGSSRFSGEWFVETPAMAGVFDALLIKGLPQPSKPEKYGVRAKTEERLLSEICETLRGRSARKWPDSSHATRISLIANDLKWPRNRVKDLYYADPRVSVRQSERDAIDAWSSSSNQEASHAE